VKESIAEILQKTFKANAVKQLEVIQSLWSGYGQIARYQLEGADIPTVIVKHIQLNKAQNHPRGWNTEISRQRKVKSYQVEQHWYEGLAKKSDVSCKLPVCYQSFHREGEQLLILEDLNAAGFSIRKSALNREEVSLGIQWLANFHATFLLEKAEGLWQEGSYWHLDTRPDELIAMQDGKLKEAAALLDEHLSNCNYRTIIHGDAKVANFCFSEGGKQIAAVDFQYVGGGCGMRDLAYFLGSCLSESECEVHEADILDEYFFTLQSALKEKHNFLEFEALEKEWRRLYPIAWADFMRFLLGWMPDHWKINAYGMKMVKRAISAP